MTMRDQPVASQICAEADERRNYMGHLTRLRTMRPLIDNGAPKMYPHLYQKLKKAQLEEDRCREIERDNGTLVKRMTRIMHRTGIDNGQPHGRAASLNRVRRRQDLERITKENLSLLKRLQERPPTYNHLQWEQDCERNEQLADRIRKFPHRANRRGLSPVRPGT